MAFKDIIPWNKQRRKNSSGDPFELMRNAVEPMERWLERPWAMTGRLNAPLLDVEETPTEIVVSAKLPGLKREDVKIDVTENSLAIRAEQSRSQEKRRHGVVRRSESSQSFYRRIALPAAIKPSEVKATFKNDRLEVRLPRAKEVEVRKIDIE